MISNINQITKQNKTWKKEGREKKGRGGKERERVSNCWKSKINRGKNSHKSNKDKNSSNFLKN